MIGEDKVMRFGGCKSGEACSIVLRGASSHVLDESERSLHDALAVLISTVKQDPKSIYGGGNTEIRMAAAIDAAAASTPGKKALAMSAYATALRQLPIIVAGKCVTSTPRVSTRCIIHYLMSYFLLLLPNIR
jgi:T-complex protein 1 subunit beta